MTENKSQKVQVAIVGSGFGGLCMAIQLQQAGISDFVVLEKEGEVGGTWRDNDYPGAACDVQSHLYSFSFAGNPNWSQRYPGWQEIQTYIHDTVEHYHLRQKILFNATVMAAELNEASGRWLVTLADGRTFDTQFLVQATGPLHHPSIPNLPGIERFKGEAFHSACWNHEVDLTDKNVVSIGTGGSAIQYIPEIAPQAKKLTVFQRSAAWVLARDERRYSALRKKLFKWLPLLRKLHRLIIYLINESRVLPISNPKMGKIVRAIALKDLYKTIVDPALREKLTPDYMVGCKRILISNRYFPTFNRDNVELVTSGIKEVREFSVVDMDGNEHPADCLVYGTGFISDPRIYMKDYAVKGIGGRDLREDWKDGAEAYYGICINGYPNLFQLVGPNTGLGHNSVIFMIENQVQYVLRAIQHTLEHQLRFLHLTADAQKQFNDDLQERLKGTVWESGCNSWYQQADGRNIVIWPGTTLRYQHELRRIRLQDFDQVY